MAKQDISSKVMLNHNDVFSDVINGLVFGKPYIDENRLKDVVPESAYEDFDGNLRSMERDLLKEYGEGDGANYFAIAEFGIGNQTTVDPTIPVRVMGYDYTVYKRQLDEYNNKKRNLYRLLKDAQEIGSAELVKRVQTDIRKLGDFRLVSVITIILNRKDIPRRLYRQCAYGQEYPCADDKFPKADKCTRRIIQRRKE